MVKIAVVFAVVAQMPHSEDEIEKGFVVSNVKMSGSENLRCWVASHDEATSAGSA